MAKGKSAAVKKPKKESQYKDPHVSVMEWINWLTVEKKPWAEIPQHAQKRMDKFIITRFLSMDLYLIEAVNRLQEDMIGMENDEFYRVYLELLPKGKLYFKYIKAQSEPDVPPNDIAMFMKYFSQSRENAIEYYQIMRRTEKGCKDIERIKRNYIYEFKESKEKSKEE